MIFWMWILLPIVAIFAAYQFGYARGVNWCIQKLEPRVVELEKNFGISQ